MDKRYKLVKPPQPDWERMRAALDKQKNKYMVYNFLGIQIVLSEIQAINPITDCYANYPSYRSNAYADLEILFKGEEGFKSIDIPFLPDSEFDRKTGRIIDLEGKLMDYNFIDISDCAASKRILPAYEKFIADLNEFNKSK